MQRDITRLADSRRKTDLLDVASAGWAVLVTLLFVAHVFGVPGPEDALRMWIYPLAVAASVVAAVSGLIRRGGVSDE